MLHQLNGRRGARDVTRPRQARLDGFDLHANAWVGANDRAELERVPLWAPSPFAQERLRVRSDGASRSS